MVAPLHALQAASASPALAGAARMRPAGSGQSTFSAAAYAAQAPAGEIWGTFGCEFRADRLEAAFEQLLLEAKTSLKIDFRLLWGSPEADARRARLLKLAGEGLRVQALAYGKPGGAAAEAIKHARQDGLAVRVFAGGEASPAPSAMASGWVIIDDRLALALLEGPQATRRARVGAWRVTGQAACELGRIFNHRWAAAGGHPLPLPELAAPTSLGAMPSRSIATLAATERTTVKQPKAVILGALQQALSRAWIMLDGLDEPELVQALVAAARRGLSVRVLLPGHGAFDRASGQARALQALQKAGVAVRRFHQGGQPQAVGVRYALVDLDQIVMTGAGWTRAGLAAPDAWAVHAKGGRMVALVESGFRSDWESGVEASPPSAGERLKGEIAPAFEQFARALQKLSPAAPLQAAWRAEVGVVRIPNAGYKFVASAGA